MENLSSPLSSFSVLAEEKPSVTGVMDGVFAIPSGKAKKTEPTGVGLVSSKSASAEIGVSGMGWGQVCVGGMGTKEPRKHMNQERARQDEMKTEVDLRMLRFRLDETERKVGSGTFSLRIS